MSAYANERASRRSRSPVNRHRHDRERFSPSRHHASSRYHRPKVSIVLPFESRPLSKNDYERYKSMFGLYLDIQKHKILEELPESEVKGRWKSFRGKWNRGELAEGWYDPSTLRKAQASEIGDDENTEARKTRESPDYGPAMSGDTSGEDLVGPSLPGHKIITTRRSKKPGPAIPGIQDLELQKELQHEDSLAQRQDLRHERRLDRKEQKQRLEDLAPRAEAGSKDRMLEKKREKADSNRAFASAKTEAGGVEEVPESDLLGGDDGGIEGFKKQKREMERKKNEREIRREEILRARMEEREERIREYRVKEEKTMSGLVALAKARFG